MIDKFWKLFERDRVMLALYLVIIALSVWNVVRVRSDVARAIWALTAGVNGFNIGMRVSAMLGRRGNLPAARVVERP